MKTSRSIRWLAALVLAWSSVAAAAGSTGPRPRSQIVEDLYDVAFTAAGRGFAVGTFGSIYATVDGGAHWTAQPTPTTAHLYGVAFADPTHGWAVGRGGTVLHTDDGGAHWTAQKSATAKHLFKVAFVDAREGWAVGDWGVVVHTADGGATWEDRSLGVDQIVYAIDFADHDHGWMVGEFGAIRRTEDGGKTWTEQAAGTQKTLFGIAAATATAAWAVGIDGLVLRTRDGGIHWEVQHGSVEQTSSEAIAFGDLLKNPGLYDVKVVGRHGVVVGDVGNVLQSADGGETWTAAVLPPEWRLSWIRGLSLAPDGAGMLVGAAGLTFRVDERGMRFSQAPRGGS